MTLTQICGCVHDDCFYCQQPITIDPSCTVARGVICDGPEIHCDQCIDDCSDCAGSAARDWNDDQILMCERGN